MNQAQSGPVERRDEFDDDGTSSGALGAAGSVRLGKYLRRLREGYGYTLRKVEERSLAMGEAIDNSQLSRFEKGKAVPSFDKLRALARVFNVPVQNFSDVLDLEELEALDDEAQDYESLIRSGAAHVAHGEHAKAFVAYERAVELAESTADGLNRLERIAEARWRMACALKAMGKLFMTERELRELLKISSQLPASTRLRCLLQLSYLYRELGDLYLALVLAKECLALCREAGDDQATEAGVLNTMGNIVHDSTKPADAIPYFRESLELAKRMSGHLEMQAMVMTNLGGTLVASGQPEEGIAMLREAHGLASQSGFRRIAALVLTRLAEAMVSRNDLDDARRKLAESDALASRGDTTYHDILFLNAFHRWSLARRDQNGTGEKIAFGRLRHLRPLLQRRFLEVDQFDQHVESARRW